MNEQTATHVAALIQNDQYDDALRLLGAELRTEPNDWYAYYFTGHAFRGIRDFRSSISAYCRSLELLPDDATEARSNVLLGLGVAFQQQGDCENAVRCFDEVIRQSPEMIAAYNSLGYTYDLMGQCEEALSTYDRALDCLFVQLYQTLSNSSDNAVFNAHNATGILWAKKAYKVAAYFGSLDGIHQCLIPTDKMVQGSRTSLDYGGLYYVDTPGASGAIRQLLPNYFNVVHERLRKDVLYCTLINNVGGTLVELDRRDEAIATFLESIEFIPDETSYPPPFIGLQQLGVDLGN